MRYPKQSTVVALLILIVGGCVPPTPGPGPVEPEPVIETPRAAAAQFADAYRAELVRVAADIATRAEAGEFEDLTAVNDAWVRGSGKARQDAQAALIRAMNKALADDRGKPGTAAGPLFRELAAGFERGSK
jgi:hypothetical protein